MRKIKSFVDELLLQEAKKLGFEIIKTNGTNITDERPVNFEIYKSDKKTKVDDTRKR